MANITKIQKKQWTKWVSFQIATSLRNSNPNSTLDKSYKNSQFCTHWIKPKRENEVIKLTSNYCNYRWCQQCGKIRTAKMINGYMPQLAKFDDLQFVTLTAPTISRQYLNKRLKEIEQAWQQMRKLFVKAKNKREIGIFKGIIKLEVTARPNDHYHPHLHILVNGRKQAEWIKAEWLKRNPKALPKLQDVKQADLGTIREIFKYVTKLVSKTENKPNYKQIHHIMLQLQGKRTFRTFGGIKKVSEEIDEHDLIATLESELEFEIYQWVDEDWWGTQTGQCLIGEPIPDKVKELVKPKK